MVPADRRVHPYQHIEPSELNSEHSNVCSSPVLRHDEANVVAAVVARIFALVDHNCDRMECDSVAVGPSGSHFLVSKRASDSNLASCRSMFAYNINKVRFR